jgi:hypothetical protein
MDRCFEEIKQEALALDAESQRALADALESELASRGDESGFREAKRRLDAIERGEMKTVDMHEAMARVRQLIRR